jgi:hypothetical protein
VKDGGFIIYDWIFSPDRNGYPATGNRKVVGIGAGKRWREEYEWIAGLSS